MKLPTVSSQVASTEQGAESHSSISVKYKYKNKLENNYMIYFTSAVCSISSESINAIALEAAESVGAVGTAITVVQTRVGALVYV